MKTMTLNDVKRLPPLTESEIARIEAFDEKFDDPECPVLTQKQLSELRPWYDGQHVRQK